MPRRDSAEQSPKGVQLFLLYILLVWEEVPGVSKSPNIGGLFENLKMFYPPEGLCRAEPERGPIVFTYDLFGYSNFTQAGAGFDYKTFMADQLKMVG